MKESHFIFDSVQLLYYKYHTINFKSLDWIKNKKATINLKNKDDQCFQYAEMLGSNYGEIKWNPERVSNVKPFINKNNKNGIKNSHQK